MFLKRSRVDKNHKDQSTTAVKVRFSETYNVGNFTLWYNYLLHCTCSIVQQELSFLLSSYNVIWWLPVKAVFFLFFIFLVIHNSVFYADFAVIESAYKMRKICFGGFFQDVYSFIPLLPSNYSTTLYRLSLILIVMLNLKRDSDCVVWRVKTKLVNIDRFIQHV